MELWEKTRDVWHQAKSAVVDGSNKIAHIVRENVPTADDVKPIFEDLFDRASEVKRKAKQSRNRVQVIRMNLINMIESYRNISIGISKNVENENSVLFEESLNTYEKRIKELVDHLLPLYAEAPYEKVLIQLREATPLFKEVSDNVEKLLKLRTIKAASVAATPIKKSEINCSIQNTLDDLWRLKALMEIKVDELEKMLNEASKVSFQALVFYYYEFLKSSDSFFNENTNPIN